MTFDLRSGLAAVGLAGVLAGGCGCAAAATNITVNGSGPRVTGSGVVAEETRTLTGFSGLVINGSADVILKAGAQERVLVRADDNIVPLITTTVDDGKLVIGLQKGASLSTRNKMVVTVEFTQMSSVLIRGAGDVRADRIATALFDVSIRGAGNVVIEQIEVDALAVSIAGSGDVTASGRAATVGIYIEGSGDVRLEGVPARQVAVRVRGSGDARVHATDSLQVDISGSGDVRYRGSPQVTRKVSGSGEVRPLR